MHRKDSSMHTQLVWTTVVTMLLTLTACDKPTSEDVADGGPPAESTPAETIHPLPPKPLQPHWLDAEIREDASGVRNVFVRNVNYTNFPNVHHILKAEVSPTGKYLLVWHRDYPPLKVSIYDVESRELISRFEPGYGGNLRWVADDLLYHQWGAGTNTFCFTIRNHMGNVVWKDIDLRGHIPTGGHLDASGKYLLVLPSLGISDEDISIHDIRDGTIFGRATKPENYVGWLDYTWLDGKTIRVWYEEWDGEDMTGPHTIDIPLDFENPIPLADANVQPVE